MKLAVGVLLLFLQVLISQSCSSKNATAESDLKLAADCNLLQRFSALVLSCGNNRCEKIIGENEQSCPQDCLDPRQHVVSYYAQSHVCPSATQVHEPKTQDELSTAVKEIRMQNKTIKLIGTRHTSTDIKCPSNGGEVIDMSAFDKIIGIEDYKGKKTIHAEGNIQFWELVSYLDEKGFALDRRFPGFGRISLAGFIATGAHGSDTKNSSSIASSIVSLEVMDSNGISKVYDQFNSTEDEWKALRANLGVLGIVTRVRLEIRPRYNIEMEIREFDASILDKPERFLDEANKCDFLFAHYMRGVKKVYFSCGHETQEPETKPGLSNALFLPPTATAFNKIAVAAFQQAACDDKAARLIEFTIDHQRNKYPWLTWKDASGKTHNERKGIGSWHRMMEAVFDSSTQPKFSQIDWEVAVPARNFASALKEMREFMDKNNVIIPTIGVIIRFDRAQEDSLLSPSSADDSLRPGEQLVHFEMPVYSPFGFRDSDLEKLRKPYRDFFLKLEEKYEARPHFGKNDNGLFLNDITKNRLKGSLEHFNAAKKILEPNGGFDNDFLKSVGVK